MKNNSSNASFERLVALIQEEIPLKIRFKDQSRRMKLMNLFIGWFVRGFMSNFTTTWGYTLYFPSKAYIEESPRRALSVLAHEAVHLLDARRYSKVLFSLAYLFPQILVLGIFSFPWLEWWALLFLLFLVPLPAPFRFYFESRAYTISILTSTHPNPENYLMYFTGWAYYCMYPFPKRVLQQFIKWERKIKQQKAPDLEKVLYWYDVARKSP